MAVDQLSETFSALADPTRRAILARLAHGEATVNELAAPFPVSLQAVSKHLKVLERAGLIARGKNAQWRPCRLRAEPLGDATTWLLDYRRFWEAGFDRLDEHSATGRSRPETGKTRKEHDMSDDAPQEGVVSAHSDAEGIVIVRVFDAPRELVFKAWTEAERFATWFGEHGSSIPLDKVSMDPRPGGAWSATMIHGPDEIELPFAGHVPGGRGARAGVDDDRRSVRPRERPRRDR